MQIGGGWCSWTGGGEGKGDKEAQQVGKGEADRSGIRAFHVPGAHCV